jgi:hypothetical protein
MVRAYNLVMRIVDIVTTEIYVADIAMDTMVYMVVMMVIAM